MADLIKVEEKNSNFFPAAVNTLALGASCICLALSLSYWQEKDIFLSRCSIIGVFVSAAIADTCNRLTKSEVAIAQLVSDAEARLVARRSSSRDDSGSRFVS